MLIGNFTHRHKIRPKNILFLPQIGMDVATQIEEGELFNFDTEVEPILEVLVGERKPIQQY
jgi:hypothetical protein